MSDHTKPSPPISWQHLSNSTTRTTFHEVNVFEPAFDGVDDSILPQLEFPVETSLSDSTPPHISFHDFSLSAQIDTPVTFALLNPTDPNKNDTSETNERNARLAEKTAALKAKISLKRTSTNQLTEEGNCIAKNIENAPISSLGQNSWSQSHPHSTTSLPSLLPRHHTMTQTLSGIQHQTSILTSTSPHHFQHPPRPDSTPNNPVFDPTSSSQPQLPHLLPPPPLTDFSEQQQEDIILGRFSDLSALSPTQLSQLLAYLEFATSQNSVLDSTTIAMDAIDPSTLQDQGQLESISSTPNSTHQTHQTRYPPIYNSSSYNTQQYDSSAPINPLNQPLPPQQWLSSTQDLPNSNLPNTPNNSLDPTRLQQTLDLFQVGLSQSQSAGDLMLTQSQFEEFIRNCTALINTSNINNQNEINNLLMQIWMQPLSQLNSIEYNSNSVDNQNNQNNPNSKSKRQAKLDRKKANTFVRMTNDVPFQVPIPPALRNNLQQGSQLKSHPSQEYIEKFRQLGTTQFGTIPSEKQLIQRTKDALLVAKNNVKKSRETNSLGGQTDLNQNQDISDGSELLANDPQSNPLNVHSPVHLGSSTPVQLSRSTPTTDSPTTNLELANLQPINSLLENNIPSINNDPVSTPNLKTMSDEAPTNSNNATPPSDPLNFSELTKLHIHPSRLVPRPNPLDGLPLYKATAAEKLKVDYLALKPVSPGVIDMTSKALSRQTAFKYQNPLLQSYLDASENEKTSTIANSTLKPYIQKAPIDMTTFSSNHHRQQQQQQQQQQQLDDENPTGRSRDRKYHHSINSQTDNDTAFNTNNDLDEDFNPFDSIKAAKLQKYQQVTGKHSENTTVTGQGTPKPDSIVQTSTFDPSDLLFLPSKSTSNASLPASFKPAQSFIKPPQDLPINNSATNPSKTPNPSITPVALKTIHFSSNPTLSTSSSLHITQIDTATQYTDLIDQIKMRREYVISIQTSSPLSVLHKLSVNIHTPRRTTSCLSQISSSPDHPTTNSAPTSRSESDLQTIMTLPISPLCPIQFTILLALHQAFQYLSQSLFIQSTKQAQHIPSSTVSTQPPTNPAIHIFLPHLEDICAFYTGFSDIPRWIQQLIPKETNSTNDQDDHKSMLNTTNDDENQLSKHWDILIHTLFNDQYYQRQRGKFNAEHHEEFHNILQYTTQEYRPQQEPQQPNSSINIPPLDFLPRIAAIFPNFSAWSHLFKLQFNIEGFVFYHFDSKPQNIQHSQLRNLSIPLNTAPTSPTSLEPTSTSWIESILYHIFFGHNVPSFATEI